MPLKIHPSGITRAWAYIKNNYLRHHYLDVEHMVPRSLLHEQRIITRLNHPTFFPKVDYTNPRVQAALINSKATIKSSHAVIVGALIGTIVYIAGAYDKSKSKRIKDQERKITKKDGRIKKMVGVIAEKEGIIAGKEGIIAEKEGVIAKKEGIIAEKDAVIKKQSDLITWQDNALKTLQLLQHQIRKCEQSRWCSFFLKQTEMQLKSSEQPKKVTVSNRKK